MAAHIKAARDVLTYSVDRGEAFAAQVIVMRDGRLVAQVMPPDGRGPVVEKVARVAAAAFGAHELVLVSDTYQATGPDRLNPLTGKTWRPGEMQDIADNHDGIARGLVHEALMVYICGPAQPDRMICLPYTRRDDKVDWGEPEDLTDGKNGREELHSRFSDLFARITPDMKVPDPIAALLMSKMDATVALAFYSDETDPVMQSLKQDLDSGRLRTR